MGSKTDPNATVGSGGIVSAAGSLSASLGKTASGLRTLGANSQVAPPAQAGAAVGVIAAKPTVTQRRVGNSITRGTQR